MTESTFESIQIGFASTSEIPRDQDLWYRCKSCGGVIASCPSGNGGCMCGNVFIDKDCNRLDVEDLAAIELVRKIKP